MAPSSGAASVATFTATARPLGVRSSRSTPFSARTQLSAADEAHIEFFFSTHNVVMPLVDEDDFRRGLEELKAVGDDGTAIATGGGGGGGRGGRCSP